MPQRRFAGVLVPSLAAITAGALLAACSTKPADPTTTSTSSGPHITTTTVKYTPDYVTIDHKKVLVPVEANNEPIDQVSSEGQNVVITPTGFEPAKLYASSKSPIVFTNLTTSKAEVVFYDWPNYPRPLSIPPGGHVSIRYGAMIIVGYGDRSGRHLGRLYIDTLPGVN